MIKAVILDLDGTLLDDNHTISKTNKEIIFKLKEKGVKVFLATGRSYNSMKEYHKELKLDTPAICFNGAKVIFPDSTYKEFPIEEKELKTLIDISHSTKTHLNIYQGEKWYVEDEINEESRIYKEISGLSPIKKDFYTLKKYFTTKALYISDHEKLLKVEKEIKKHLGESVYTTFSKTFFLEVMKNNVNKGTTMTKVFKDEGIDINKTIAFGDGLNDIEMLKMAGVGVAMDGAFKELKDIADYITISNSKSGVGEFLKKYL